MRINTVIVEDEEKSLYVLQELIRQSATDIDIVGIASHVEKAVRLIESTAPQLVFLDIRIADGLGFEVLQQLQQRDFELICITAYDDYALDAFRFSAIDYLLKPVGMEECQEALTRVRKRLTERRHHDTIGALLHNLAEPNNKKIGIPTANSYDFIDLGAIVWCHSNGGYTTFHLTDGSKHVACRTLGVYEAMLCNGSFVRIHHSAIINTQHIKSYVKGNGGYVVMSDNTKLEVSQRRKAAFLKRLML